MMMMTSTFSGEPMTTDPTNVLATKRDPQEQAAVEKWLAAGNAVTKAETGVSGIYDKDGLPLYWKRGWINEGTKKRLRISRELAAQGFSIPEIAKHLDMSESNYRAMLNRWGGPGV